MNAHVHTFNVKSLQDNLKDEIKSPDELQKFLDKENLKMFKELIVRSWRNNETVLGTRY